MDSSGNAGSSNKSEPATGWELVVEKLHSQSSSSSDRQEGASYDPSVDIMKRPCIPRPKIVVQQNPAITEKLDMRHIYAFQASGQVQSETLRQGKQ